MKTIGLIAVLFLGACGGEQAQPIDAGESVDGCPVITKIVCDDAACISTVILDCKSVQ